MNKFIKNLVEMYFDEHKCLIEMAEIGKVPSKKLNFIIYIWSRDGGYIPHIHIGDAETYPKCTKFQTALKLQTPEYFPHGEKYTDTFNNKQLDSIINFLNSEDEDGDSIWRFILKTWNKNNFNVKIPIDTKIPDYNKLKS